MENNGYTEQRLDLTNSELIIDNRFIHWGGLKCKRNEIRKVECNIWHSEVILYVKHDHYVEVKYRIKTDKEIETAELLNNAIKRKERI